MQGDPKISDAVTLGKGIETIREVVHISQGGKTMRVTLTNEFGTSPLTVSSAHVAFLSAGDRILPTTDHVLTFGGKPSVTIPAGQFVASDPINLTLPIFSDLVFSLAVPEQHLPTITLHSLGMTTTYFAKGDATAAEALEHPETTHSWYLLKDVQVNSEKKSAAIVMLGDSITDGAHSTIDANRRWPDVLAARLSAEKKTKALSVLNEGISGNRILHFLTGPRALDRLDRDVLAAPGVRYVVLLEGINDIGHVKTPRTPADVVTAQEIIDGMHEIVMRMRARGIKIIGATLTPFGGTVAYANDATEAMRQQVNAYIRTPGNFDGVIDFEKVTQDPAHPDRFLPAYDCGDHLHPNDAGYAAMGNAIDLKLFR
jgi:lysophospholipase L1-like esterase